MYAVVGPEALRAMLDRARTFQSFTMRTYLDWQNEGVRRVDDLRIEHIIPELASSDQDVDGCPLGEEGYL